MHIYISGEDLKALLQEVKNQSIEVAIQSNKGKWLTDYFSIEEISEFESSSCEIPVLILRSVINSRCTILDIRNILCVKLNKYLQRNGELLDKIIVLSAIPGYAESASDNKPNSIILTI